MNILKKKVHILLLLLTISITSMISISNVWGDVSISPSNPPGGGNGTCSNINCFFSGIETTGARFALVDSKGDIVGSGHPVDYWYINESGQTVNEMYLDSTTQHQVAFKEKYLKQQLLNMTNEQLIDNLEVNGFGSYSTSKFNSLSNVYDISGLNDKVYSFDKYIINSGRWNKTNTANDILVNIIDVQANYVNPDTNEIERKYNFINNLFKDMGYNFTGETMTNHDYYLQVEPLVSWGHGHIAKCDTGYYVFHGTVSELMAIGYNNLISIPCPEVSGTDVYPFGHGTSKSIESYNHNLDVSFHDKKYYGVFADKQDKMPNNFKATTKNANASANFYDKDPETQKYYAYGVGYLSLEDIGINDGPDPCNKITLEYLKGKKYEDFTSGILDELALKGKENTNNKYGWLTEYKSFGLDDSMFIDYLSDDSHSDCEIPSCDRTAKNLVDSRLSNGTIDERLAAAENFRNELINLYKKYLNYLSTNVSQINFLKDGNSGNYYGIDAYFVNTKFANKENLCSAATCNSILTSPNVKKGENDYDEDLVAVLAEWTNYLFLFKEYYEGEDGSGEGPQCANPDACVPETITPSCEEPNNKFIFKDAVKTDSGINENCDMSKYAYNNVKANGTVDASSTEYSKDSTYGNKGYCWESVEFNFPTGIKYSDAGLIMKWGINSNKYNEKFGTMEVYRRCYIDTNSVSENFILDSSWANVENSVMPTGARINPKIEMNYREATQKGTDAYILPSTDLSVYLSKINFDVTFKDDTLAKKSAEVSYDKEGNILSSTNFTGTNNNDRNRNYQCEDSCKNIKFIEMRGTYDIVYPNDLKWYADSGEYDKKRTYSNIVSEDSEAFEPSGEISSRYVSIGYGLPTSFLTPNTKEDKWLGVGDEDGNGYMYVNLSQVGTKVGENHYHFDKYIVNFVADVYKTNPSMIKYNCPFRIGNPLYDNENPRGGGDKIPPEPDNPDYTPKEIDIVFRTVQLVTNDYNVAFPGRSGDKTRKKGYNWGKLDNSSVKSVLHSSIYNYEPKYKIKLDTTLIQKIREKNSTDKNPYVSKKDYVSRKVNETATASQVNEGWSDIIGNTYSINQRLYIHLNSKNGPIVLNTPYAYEYTYMASNFLSDLANDNALNGTCMTVKDSAARAEAYSKTFGC